MHLEINKGFLYLMIAQPIAQLLNNNIALQNIKIVLFQEPSKTGAGKITEQQASGAGILWCILSFLYAVIC